MDALLGADGGGGGVGGGEQKRKSRAEQRVRPWRDNMPAPKSKADKGEAILKDALGRAEMIIEGGDSGVKKSVKADLEALLEGDGGSGDVIGGAKRKERPYDVAVVLKYMQDKKKQEAREERERKQAEERKKEEVKGTVERLKLMSLQKGRERREMVASRPPAYERCDLMVSSARTVCHISCTLSLSLSIYLSVLSLSRGMSFCAFFYTCVIPCPMEFLFADGILIHFLLD